VTVFCGSTEIGQGSDSILAYIVAEVLGIDCSFIRVVTGDTDLTPVDLGSYSSRVTLMTGNAAIQAAERARAMLDEAVAEELKIRKNRIVAAQGRMFDSEDPSRAVDFAKAVQLAEAKFGTLGTVGSYTPPKSAAKYKGGGVGPSPTYSFSAAVVELAIDPETGVLKIEKTWIAPDIGRAINPVLAIGQVEGSVYMGLGEALMEEQEFRLGVHKTPSMLDYKSPTSMDMCSIETILVEEPDPVGPFGAKEVGQGPLLPIPPAVCNAVHDAVGVRIDEIPVTPEKNLKALKAKSQGKDGRYGPTAFPSIDYRDPMFILPPWEGGDGRAMNQPEYWAVSSTDLAPVMLALNARIHLLSKDGERTIEAAQMYNNDGIAYLAKRSNEIVTAVDLPAINGDITAFQKLLRRGSIDFPILNVAVWLRPAKDKKTIERRPAL
jgi:Molybdopterin-binding domain of aldehyde dehydrogenase/FAD binding domain in molybdopterin dehydrogenase